jgi:hypothetical protein
VLAGLFLGEQLVIAVRVQGIQLQLGFWSREETRQ